MPSSRNRCFTARGNTLRQLQTALAKGPVALSGMPGVGKTELAIEYAHRHRDAYSAVFWVHAESFDTLNASFSGLAERLALPERTAPEQERVVQAVIRWWQTHSGWLLIFDNADDLALVESFIPTDVQGQKLFTTREHALGHLAERLPVPMLTAKEGGLLLLRRAGFKSANKAPAPVCSTAEAISDDVGGLPLALDQAGAYIEQTQSSFDEYRRLYEQYGKELRAKRGDRPATHRDSVTITLRLALAEVEKRSPAAADLLRLCAFFNPEQISEFILTEHPDHLDGTLSTIAGHPLQWADTRGEACRWSLLESEQGLLSMHRLVKAVLIDEMPREIQREWAICAIRVVNGAFPSGTFDVVDWPRCEQLLHHAEVCAAHIEQWSIESEVAGALLIRTGFYLQARGRYEQAAPLVERALAILEKVLGGEHPNVATSLSNLALLYRAQGRYEQAAPLYARALAIREKVFGGEHP